MHALAKHFQRLRELLGDDQAEELEAAYKKDKAADERASRQKQRHRWEEMRKRRQQDQ